MNKIIKWWFTPYFPDEHTRKVLAYNPIGFRAFIRDRYRTWIVHPIKRRFVKYYVEFLQNFFGLKVIGITGSSGKTTTKEMLASILKLSGETIYSFANIDPVYNIPSTILKCTPETKYLILEMGVEYPTEMDFYLWLVKPQIGIITNIYPTHTIYFGQEKGVFKEKSKLVKNLASNNYAILNSESKYLDELKNIQNCKILWFGKKSDIEASEIVLTKDFKTKFNLRLKDKKIKVDLPILGEQFVTDALAAASSAYALNISEKTIKKGLEAFEIQQHRMNIKKLKSGCILIDDSYNNNPEAAKKAIEMLKQIAGKRKTVLIFGDMLELGKEEISYHKEIGALVRKLKISEVFGIGELSKYVCSNKNWSPDWHTAIDKIKPQVKKGTLILIKGSRSTGLDNIVAALS